MIKSMTLGVKERFLMVQFFPPKGTMKDQILARAIKRKIDIPKEERESIALKIEKGEVSWDGELEKPLTIELNDEEREFLKRQTGRLDDEAAYTPEILELAERIKGL